MKIVIDNNVFVSGIFWKGPPHKIIKLAEQNRLQIFASRPILNELFGVLKRDKFALFVEEAQTSVDDICKKILELVQVSSPESELQVIKKDPADNKFLACAVAIQACFIVSGDSHLLDLKKFQDIPILTPRQFLEHLKI